MINLREVGLESLPESVTPAFDAKVRRLLERVSALDRKHEREREALIRKGLLDLQATAACNAARVTGPRRHNRSAKHARVKRRSASILVPGDPTPPISQVVRQAVAAQDRDFRVLDIKAFVEQRYPALAPKATSDRISVELTGLRANKLIRFVAKEQKGGAYIYRYAGKK